MYHKGILFVFLTLLSLAVWAQPANDDCANAMFLDVEIGETLCVNSSTIGANTSGENGGQTCKPVALNEVWFTFSAQGSQNQAVVNPIGANPAQSLVVQVRNDPCGDLRLDDCGAAVNPGDSAAAVAGFQPGSQVWVDVSAIDANGEFEICITSFNPPPTPGNSCPEAERICDKSTIDVANLNNLNSSGFEPDCFKNNAGAPEAVRQDIWYKFTVGKDGVMEWLATPSMQNSEFDWAMYDITDGCPDGADPVDIQSKEIACNYNFGGGNSDPIGMEDGSNTVCPITSLSGEYPKEICPPYTFGPNDIGRTFAIMMSNFSQNGSGFNIEWGGDFEIAPTAQFDITQKEDCDELSTHLVDDAIASVQWEFSLPGANPDTFYYEDNVNVPPLPPDSFQIVYDTPGNYLATVVTTSATGCTDVHSIPIRLAALELSTSKVDANCSAEDGVACVTPDVGEGPFTYTWTQPGNDSCLVDIGEGEYTVIVEDGTGLCSKSEVVEIESPGSVVADFEPNPIETDVFDPNFTFTDLSSDGDSWTWNFGDGSDTMNISNAVDGSTTYTYPAEIDSFMVTLIVTNEAGCIDSITKTVFIKGFTTFYVPNIFTPDNDDSKNDLFGGYGYGIEEYNMWLYDRWGLLIWESNNLSQMWDGKKQNGTFAPEDVYVWKAKIVDVDGEEHDFVGHVSLVR